MVLDLILKEKMHLLMSVLEKIQVRQLASVSAWTRAVVWAPVMHLRMVLQNSLASGVQACLVIMLVSLVRPQHAGQKQKLAL